MVGRRALSSYGEALGLVEDAGFLSGSPSSTVQALPPSECFSLVHLQGVTFADDITISPSPPWKHPKAPLPDPSAPVQPGQPRVTTTPWHLFSASPTQSVPISALLFKHLC